MNYENYEKEMKYRKEINYRREIKYKRGSAVGILIFLILVVLLVIAGWFLYQNLPSKSVNLFANFKGGEFKVANLSGNVKQFYSNMRFANNKLSYKIDDLCDDDKVERVKEAFDIIRDRTGIISFYLSTGNVDVEVSCINEMHSAEDIGSYIAGEGGGGFYVPTERYAILENRTIKLYDSNTKCNWPIVELHELAHVLGFDHSANEESLMYPILQNCKQKLDESIINDLKILYSQEALADLYFVDVSGEKSGRYLDFTISVGNSGLITAENVILTVYDENKEIEEFKLGDVKPGAKTNLKIQNLKLSSRTSDNIDIKIDSDNLIKEIDELNNNVNLEIK